MTLGAFTVFYPRMELDHLKSWIDYHLRLGVEKIYLYDNGNSSVDKHFGTGEEQKVWAKKPEANYNLDLSDVEIRNELGILLNPFLKNGCVEVIDWPNILGIRDFCESQNAASIDCLRRAREDGIDWLAFIDIDELIVSPMGPIEEVIFSIQAEGYVGISLKQKLFVSRWSGGQPLQFKDITKTYGMVSWNPKVIARVDATKKWGSAHSIQTEGRVCSVRPKFLRYHHFRGNSHHAEKVKWVIPKYTALKWTGKRDATHTL